MNDEVKSKVIEAIAEVADFEPGDITMGDRLLEDLGMDSLDFAKLEQNLEERLEIDVDPRSLQGVITVGELVARVGTLVHAESE